MRNYYFDNAKLILIILVVVGHFINPIIFQDQALMALYLTIYSFHMPVMIFIAGYFSGSTKGKMKGLIKRLLIPFVIFQPLFLMFNIFLFPKTILNLGYITTPFFVMWFLPCLLIWKMTLPYLKSKYIVPISLIIAVFVGYLPFVGLDFTLSRLITFLPIFLLGYHLRDKEFNFGTKAKVISIFALMMLAIFCYYKPFHIWWLYGSEAYEVLNHPEWYAGVYRMLVYFGYGLASISFMALVPRKKYFFSNLGKNTMTVYLVHGFIRLILSYSNIYTTIDTPLEKTVLILLSILIALCLAVLPNLVNKLAYWKPSTAQPTSE